MADGLHARGSRRRAHSISESKKIATRSMATSNPGLTTTSSWHLRPTTACHLHRAQSAASARITLVSTFDAGALHLDGPRHPRAQRVAAARRTCANPQRRWRMSKRAPAGQPPSSLRRLIGTGFTAKNDVVCREIQMEMQFRVCTPVASVFECRWSTSRVQSR